MRLPPGLFFGLLALVTAAVGWPMARGQSIEVELDHPRLIEEVSIKWLGDKPYQFIIYEKPWSDVRSPMLEGKSAGHGGKLETYRLPKPVQTRAVRIEFQPSEDGGPQGIGYARRDYPMRKPSPPIHEITVAPMLQIEANPR
jgi:hypothetical protein